MRTFLDGVGIIAVVLLILSAFVGAFRASRNSGLTSRRKVIWVLVCLLLPGAALFYFELYERADTTDSIDGLYWKGRYLAGLGSGTASFIAVLVIFPLFTKLAEFNSQDMLKDYTYSYWAKDFDEMNAQVMAKTMPQYDAIIKSNDENAFTYYRRGQLKERYERKSGRSDFQMSLKLVTNSLEDEDDPKRLDMLRQFKASVESELNRK